MTKSRTLILGGLAVLMLVAVGQPAFGGPVGRLESMNVAINQGSTSYSFPVSFAVSDLDGTEKLLGQFGGNDIYICVQADQRNVAEIDNRWYGFTVKAKTPAGAKANLFNPTEDGDITVSLTNMDFDNVTGLDNKRVEPFNPNDYADVDTPFFYLLDHGPGFVDLPGAEQYSPDGTGTHNLSWPSLQVPMGNCDSSGYGFTQQDNGLNTGFVLSNIPDFGGTEPGNQNPLDIVPILWNSPYFGPAAAPVVPGFADEFGVVLNMRGYEVPEPTTALLLIVPAFFMRRRRVV